MLKVQDHCPATPVFHWQIGTNALENLFAVVQTLAHGNNIDWNELGDRLGAAVALEEIYAKHPSWAKKSPRLSLAHLGEFDHMNDRTCAEAGPVGSCDVRSVKVAACWNEGRRIVIGVLRDHEEYTVVTHATCDHVISFPVTLPLVVGVVYFFWLDCGLHMSRAVANRNHVARFVLTKKSSYDFVVWLWMTPETNCGVMWVPSTCP